MGPCTSETTALPPPRGWCCGCRASVLRLAPCLRPVCCSAASLALLLFDALRLCFLYRVAVVPSPLRCCVAGNSLPFWRYHAVDSCLVRGRFAGILGAAACRFRHALPTCAPQPARGSPWCASTLRGSMAFILYSMLRSISESDRMCEFATCMRHFRCNNQCE